MIIVFLIILVAALIIANILVSISRQRRTEEKILSAEKGLINPSLNYVEPEVITHVQNLNENTALMQGSILATNKKLELLNERVSLIEKIVTQLVEKKINTNLKEIDEN